MTASAHRLHLIWPGADERRLLARFYMALGIDRALYLVFPFEFAYFYLVMDRPEWSVLPLMAASATSLAMQLPTGALADRWGRKPAVLSGGVLTAASFAAVPWAVDFRGGWQLLATCIAFSLAGLGETLMNGAEEAWVVDNLRAAGREDLVDAFFARSFAVTAAGGIVASGIALVLLVSHHVDLGLLDFLWYGSAIGFLVSIVVALSIHEERVGASVSPEAASALFPRMRQALSALVHTRVLLLLTIAVVIAALSGAAADDAFPVSLLTKGFDARGLAPVGIVDDLFGIGAPILGLALARRIGPERVLSATMVVAGLSVATLFAWRGVWVVLVLFILLDFLDRVWDPVSLARLQQDIPSAHRAAIGSLVYQANGLAQLGGLGLFALVLGGHSKALRDATPDLVEAFSGHAQVTVPVPRGLFGLSVPDTAIVIFVLVGVLAVPFVMAAARARRHLGVDPPADPPGGPTTGLPREPAGGPTTGPPEIPSASGSAPEPGGARGPKDAAGTGGPTGHERAGAPQGRRERQKGSNDPGEQPVWIVPSKEGSGSAGFRPTGKEEVPCDVPDISGE